MRWRHLVEFPRGKETILDRALLRGSILFKKKFAKAGNIKFLEDLEIK